MLILFAIVIYNFYFITHLVIQFCKNKTQRYEKKTIKQTLINRNDRIQLKK